LLEVEKQCVTSIPCTFMKQFLCKIRDHLADTIGVIDDLCSTPTTTTDPHAGIEEGVPLVTSFEFDSDTEFVQIWWSGIGLSRISQLLQDFSRASAPAKRLDGNVCWRVILGLQ
jgi:hypothetical protein